MRINDWSSNVFSSVLDLDLASILERINLAGSGDQDVIAHRHQVDHVPERPPPAAPVAGAGGGRAAAGEAPQDMQDAVRPLMCHAVDGVGENRDREVESRQPDGAADAALEAAGVAEPLPTPTPTLAGAEADARQGCGSGKAC